MVARKKSWRFGIKALSGIGALAVTASLLANANPATAAPSTTGSTPSVAASDSNTDTSNKITYPNIFGTVIQDSSAPKSPTFKVESRSGDQDIYALQWTAPKPPAGMEITGYTVRYIESRDLLNGTFQYSMSIEESPDWSACADLDGSSTNTAAKCELLAGSQPIFLVQASLGPVPGTDKPAGASHPGLAVDSNLKRIIDDRNFTLNPTRNELIARARTLLTDAHQQGIGEVGKKFPLKKGGLLAIAIYLMGNAVITKNLDGFMSVVSSIQIKAPTQRPQISKIDVTPGEKEHTAQITAHFTQPLGDIFSLPMTVALACSSTKGVYTGSSAITATSRDALPRSVTVTVPYGDHRCGIYGSNRHGSTPTTTWPNTLTARAPKAFPEASAISYTWNPNGTLTASWADPEPTNDYYNTSVKAVATGTDRKVNADHGGLPAIECVNKTCQTTLVMGQPEWGKSELLLTRDSKSGNEAKAYDITGRLITSIKLAEPAEPASTTNQASGSESLPIAWKVDTANTNASSVASYRVGYRELQGEATELDVMNNDISSVTSKTLDSYTACTSNTLDAEGKAQAECAGLSTNKDYSIRVFAIDASGAVVASSGTLIVRGEKPSSPADASILAILSEIWAVLSDILWLTPSVGWFTLKNIVKSACDKDPTACLIILAVVAVITLGVSVVLVVWALVSNYFQNKVRLPAPKLEPVEYGGKSWMMDENGTLVSGFRIDVEEGWTDSVKDALSEIQSGTKAHDYIDVDQKYHIKCGDEVEVSYTAEEIVKNNQIVKIYFDNGYDSKTCRVRMTYTVKAHMAKDLHLETPTSEITLKVGQLPPAVSNISATPVISGDAERALNVEFTPAPIKEEQRMATGFIIEAVPQGEQAGKFETVTYRTPATHYQHDEPGTDIPAVSYVLGGEDSQGELRGGVTYLVTVRAVNAIGESDAGSSSAVVTMPNRAPEKVQLSAALQPIESRAVLSWSFKGALNGSPVASQEINCSTPDSAFTLSENMALTFQVPVVPGQTDYSFPLTFAKDKGLKFGERYKCALLATTAEGFTSTSIESISVMLEELLPAIEVPTQRRSGILWSWANFAQRPVFWRIPSQYVGRINWVIEYDRGGQWVRWNPNFLQTETYGNTVYIYLGGSDIKKGVSVRVYAITESGRYSAPRVFVAK